MGASSAIASGDTTALSCIAYPCTSTAFLLLSSKILLALLKHCLLPVSCPLHHPSWLLQVEDHKEQFREAFNNETEHSQPDYKERMNLMCTVTKKLFDAKDDKVKAASSNQNSEDFSICGENLVMFLQPMLDAICAHTGPSVALLAGGPGDAGDFDLMIVSSGTVEGKKFENWNEQSFVKDVVNNFLLFVDAGRGQLGSNFINLGLVKFVRLSQVGSKSTQVSSIYMPFPDAEMIQLPHDQPLPPPKKPKKTQKPRPTKGSVPTKSTALDATATPDRPKPKPKPKTCNIQDQSGTDNTDWVNPEGNNKGEFASVSGLYQLCNKLRNQKAMEMIDKSLGPITIASWWVINPPLESESDSNDPVQPSVPHYLTQIHISEMGPEIEPPNLSIPTALTAELSLSASPDAESQINTDSL
ncbi:hypothetical protein BDP27DRAFT_1368474 [Rhodocollybia butyracea]|uniref:Uncharacterized protein n=1 Tax=Rhodocollybia butyracea TaxID=206335 RepID=A0A9P5PIY2_9AGAR|nr:hypothetical protein BDP27DRAFT_1368474 [Rhodocollybia butyracea]